MDRRPGSCHAFAEMRFSGRRALGVWALVAMTSAQADSAAHRGEAGALAMAILTGSAPVPGAVARIHFLGEERFAAAQLEAQVTEAPAEGRRRVAEALADLNVPSSFPALTLLAADEDAATRMYAVQGLGRLGKAEARVTLEKGLQDSNLGVRRSSAKALGLLGQSAAGPALMHAALGESDVETRALLLEAVGASGDRRQAKALALQLNSSSETVRFAAARALCLLRSPAGFAEARRRLQSAEATDREQGLRLLEGVPERDARPVLQPLLDGDDPVLAARAKELLARARQGSTP